MASVSSGGGMLRPEEENDTEVRREDQDNINKFASLNAKLHEVRAEREEIQKRLEGIDDASTELMMGSGDKVLLMLGEAFFEVSEEDATEHCEALVEKLQAHVDKLSQVEADILDEQASLKKILYGRFGKSIQLEN
jgi:prefoldin subunit 4